MFLERGDDMNKIAKRTGNFLNSEHKGAETFEVVVIVAILVIVILALFTILRPALETKAQSIAADIARAGTDGPTPPKP